MSQDKQAELTQRLRVAIKKKDRVSSELERLKGQREAAQKSLAEVEAECRAKKIDPNEIDTFITKVEARFEQLVESLETSVATAEADLAPYLGEDDEDDLI